MELRCPECCSPEVELDPQGPGEAQRCGNCGARFARGGALVTVLEAESRGPVAVPSPLFTFDRRLAAKALSEVDGGVSTVNPYSDADELNALLDTAQAASLITREGKRAWLYIYPLSVGEPEPLLVVDPGQGPTLLGCSLKLRQGDDEDPISFTARILEELTEEANALAAGRVADSARLDRIAAFMNAQRPWSGGDVCEFVATELHESGRRLLDADD